MINLAVTNIFNKGREILLFHRTGEKLNIFRDVTFFPYYYEPSHDGIYRAYITNQKLKKIVCRDPWQATQERTNLSYESDIIYTKRYLIDKINILPTKIRYIMFDAEMLTTDLPDPAKADKPVCCITGYDNYTQEYASFYIEDYESEYKMILGFINWVREHQPDLMIAYNAYGFDYPYLTNRFPDFAEKLSPVGQVIKRNNFPAGISIIDYLEWIKKVHKYKKNSLEYVYCSTFKKEYQPIRYDFSKLSPEVKDKNTADVRKMVELENKLHMIEYFDNMRRASKVLWDDMTKNSVLIDNDLLQIAKEKGVILAKKPDYEEIEDTEDAIEGAYVYAEPGLHDSIQLFDVSGTYPNLIITFNLDPVNKRDISGNNTVTINGVHIEQNSNAIVPTLCTRLTAFRETAQKDMENKTGDEYDLLKTQDAALKSRINSVYGILLFKRSRLFDKDIASTITFLARDLIHYCQRELENRGHHVILLDTDSQFIRTNEKPEVIEKLLNEELIPAWLKLYGKSSGRLKFKYEGILNTMFVATKKHYVGNLIKPSGEIKSMKKGVESVRSDASKFIEKFQDELFKRILNKDSKESIINWIKDEVKEFRKNSLLDIAFPCKLSKPVNEYKTETVHLRALRYTQDKDPSFQVRIGDSFYYTYVISEESESKTTKRKVTRKLKSGNLSEIKDVITKKNKNVIAFNEYNYQEIKNIDYEQLLDRNIYKKCEVVFEAMGWDMKEIGKEKIQPKKQKSKNIKDSI